MVKNMWNQLKGLLLLAFCAGIWAWMLGWFAKPLPPGSLKDAPMLAAWMAPGVMGFPALVSIIAGVAGLLYVMGVFPLTTSANNVSRE
ncbi:hypothetical protein G3O06_05265 [Burkholderia sp. Ac-20345]|uniref:hypothetical protein n=1 Tax=Burkholderia sp. Ac-20345 TaxID=2703891 RepID=UPI00197B915D|nr:hypothetical protein [Burkholderia sp. Ac-20345]MBN3776978.1 hypothetical protein [Burkholderia sp. Ac-20345]